MSNTLSGAQVFTVSELDAPEYAPNRGVFLAGILGRERGDGFGLYRGTMEPGCEIAREIHPETSETVYILAGSAVATVEDAEVTLSPGQVIHIDKNVHHGLRNVGDTVLDFIVIGHPDF
jgi:quercetin dioxygenase-like cupin family protein